MTGLNHFNSRLRQRLEEKLPFVIYHKPKSGVIRSWFPKSIELVPQEKVSGSGFVFSPFDPDSSVVLFPLSESEILETTWDEKSFRPDQSTEAATENDGAMPGGDQRLSDKVRHVNLVRETIDYIRSEKVSKIVVSRKEEIRLKDSDPLVHFKALLQNYPKAFVYLWYHPKIGMWAGASPEKLLSVENEVFRTMSLAGTQVYQEEIVTAWGVKEIEEQQMVTEMIEKELKGQLTRVGRPYDQRAGHLVHLRTDIEGRIGSGTHPGSIIRKLHPTAAVCGMPRNRALDYILRSEGYSREFYTGYLGELLGPEGKDTHLFVNLRCMQLRPEENTAWIYVGGGITSSSDPEKEWEETAAKSQTMKRCIS
jgi:isochorismate synthase